MKSSLYAAYITEFIYFSLKITHKVFYYETYSQILDEAVCISYSANTLKKGMNPTIHPPGMDK